jgi:hypothetical protein
MFHNAALLAWRLWQQRGTSHVCQALQDCHNQLIHRIIRPDPRPWRLGMSRAGPGRCASPSAPFITTAVRAPTVHNRLALTASPSPSSSPSHSCSLTGSHTVRMILGVGVERVRAFLTACLYFNTELICATVEIYSTTNPIASLGGLWMKLGHQREKRYMCIGRI